MVAAPEMPKDLQACESCGHVPEEAKRYAWLAGCPKGHVFHLWFDINWLAYQMVHEWMGDQTYSALKIGDHRIDEATILEWLDAVHAGKIQRRPKVWGEMAQFDDLIREQNVNPINGDITVTYRLPLLEGG